MTLIGITGTMGAGKGTVTDYLVRKKGFVHYSAREFLVEEITRRGMPVNRNSMIAVSNDLRTIHSPSYIIEQLLKRAQEKNQDAVLESVLVVGEVELLHQAGALLVSVDADQKTRYERIVARQSETDQVTFETFVAQEEKKRHSDNPAEQSVADVMSMADIQLTNSGTVEDLETELERVLVEKRF